MFRRSQDRNDKNAHNIAYVNIKQALFKTWNSIICKYIPWTKNNSKIVRQFQWDLSHYALCVPCGRVWGAFNSSAQIKASFSFFRLTFVPQRVSATKRHFNIYFMCECRHTSEPHISTGKHTNVLPAHKYVNGTALRCLSCVSPECFEWPESWDLHSSKRSDRATTATENAIVERKSICGIIKRDIKPRRRMLSWCLDGRNSVLKQSGVYIESPLWQWLSNVSFCCCEEKWSLYMWN